MTSKHECSDGSTPSNKPADSSSEATQDNPTEPVQTDMVVEGKLVLPPTTSPHEVRKPKKTYPPGPPGKVLIFRWQKTDPKTGRTIRAHGRPFPMWVDP